MSCAASLRRRADCQPRFMASEEELDTEIKTFSILSEHPELFAEFRRLGSLGSLVRLLAHENTDIAVDVVEVISELTDDEVEAEPEQWNALVDGMVDESLLEMLTQNLARLNEGNDSDRSGVYHTLSESPPRLPPPASRLPPPASRLPPPAPAHSPPRRR